MTIKLDARLRGHDEFSVGTSPEGYDALRQSLTLIDDSPGAPKGRKIAR